MKNENTSLKILWKIKFCLIPFLFQLQTHMDQYKDGEKGEVGKCNQDCVHSFQLIVKSVCAIGSILGVAMLFVYLTLPSLSEPWFGR